MPAYRVSWAVALSLLVCGSPATSQRAEPSPSGPIEWEADSFSLDRKAGVTTFDGFRIEAGSWTLVADRASAHSDSLDFGRGEWRFEGHVRVSIDGTSVTADQAVFTFDDKELVVAELTGTPVVFEEPAADSGEPVVGQAEQLRLDYRNETVELIGSVALTVGPYKTTGCDLVYFLGTERFTTGSLQCSEPFRTIIVREEDGDEPASEP